MRNGSESGGRVHVMRDCAWDERATTWDTAPAMADVAVVELGPVRHDHTVEVDLSSMIHGDGTYCLTLDSKSPDRVDYQSREAPRGAPQLIVDVAP